MLSPTLSIILMISYLLTDRQWAAKNNPIFDKLGKCFVVYAISNFFPPLNIWFGNCNKQKAILVKIRKISMKLIFWNWRSKIVYWLKSYPLNYWKGTNITKVPWSKYLSSRWTINILLAGIYNCKNILDQ